MTEKYNPATTADDIAAATTDPVGALHAQARAYADQFEPLIRATGRATFKMPSTGPSGTDGDAAILMGAAFAAVVAEIAHELEMRGIPVIAAYAPIATIEDGATVTGEDTMGFRGAWQFALADLDEGDR